MWLYTQQTTGQVGTVYGMHVYMRGTMIEC